MGVEATPARVAPGRRSRTRCRRRGTPRRSDTRAAVGRRLPDARVAATRHVFAVVSSLSRRLQGVVKEPVLAARRPRPRQLMFVEDSEFHRGLRLILVMSRVIASLDPAGRSIERSVDSTSPIRLLGACPAHRPSYRPAAANRHDSTDRPPVAGLHLLQGICIRYKPAEQARPQRSLERGDFHDRPHARPSRGERSRSPVPRALPRPRREPRGTRGRRCGIRHTRFFVGLRTHDGGET